MNILKMNVDNSFQDYCKGLQVFWKEEELYGSISPVTKIVPADLEFNKLLTPESQYLEKLRK